MNLFRQHQMDHVFAAGMFLLPVLMAVVEGAASAIFILLFLCSVYGLTQQRSVGIERLCRADRLTAFFLLMTICIVLAGYVNADDTQQYWSRFERLLRALGCVVIFLYFVGSRFNPVPVFERGVVLGSMVVFFTAIYQSMSQIAAEGAYNSILFGDFSAYLACAAGAAAIGSRNRPTMALLFLASAGLSAYASVLSGTRGAWIGLYFGFLFLVIVWLFFVFRHSRSALPLGLSALGGALLVFLLSLHPIVSARSLDAFQTFADFLAGGNPNTSVGYRLQMWEAAYRIWLINPILGSGLGDYSRDLSEMIRLGESSMNAHFGEAHSLYFEFLGTTGLLGLLTLMAGMFVLPLLRFLGVGRGGGISRLLDSPASLHGACLVITFFSFGISQNWLGRSSISSVFFLCLALFLAAVARERSKNGISDKGQNV